MMSNSELFRRIERETLEIDRAVESYRDKRMEAINRQVSAEDRYVLELKEIRDLEDVDNELGKIEEEQQQVDHNIMRHLYMTLQSDSYGEGFDMDNAGAESIDEQAYLDEQEQFQHRLPRRNSIVVDLPRREPPSAEIKEGMREALFGYLDAARADELELEYEYEQSKENGDNKAAEQAGDRLFVTQKANVTALLKMIKNYHPHTSGNVWGNDPDFQTLAKQMKLYDST